MKGRLNVAIVLLGYIIVFLIIILIIVTKKSHKTEYDLSIPEEPIPLEERIEHDLDVKFEEWVQKVEAEPVSAYLIEVSEEEKALMARVVMSEVGSDYIDIDIKQAVASTIVNRVRSGKWGNTVTEVVTYPHAYWMGDNGEPTADCWEAVEAALTYEAFPTDMYYFKEGAFHDFGYPCMRIGNTFFSTEKAAWD